MESKNIFKANIIVSELSDFFEELDDETEKRFLDIRHISEIYFKEMARRK